MKAKQREVWPVYGHRKYFERETLALFFSSDAAERYAMDPVRRDGWNMRNLYCAPSRMVPA